jgi:hypothetical protein
MATTTYRIIRHTTNKLDIIASTYSDRWADLAIEERNDLLDEYRRAEQTIEALAEARKDAR